MEMFVNHKYPVRIVVAILVLVSLVVTLPTVAAQEPPTDESPSEGVSYTSVGSSGNFLTQWLTGWLTANYRLSPSDCIQWPNDPRFSNPDNVSSSIRAACRVQAPEMYHVATLRKKEEGSSQWRFAASGSFHDTWVQRGTAFANTDCENMRYQVEGEGWVIDVDNKIYYASTMSREVNNPCNYP